MRHLFACTLLLAVGCSKWSEYCENVRDSARDSTSDVFVWGRAHFNPTCFTEEEVQASAADDIEAEFKDCFDSSFGCDLLLSERISRLSPEDRKRLQDRIDQFEFKTASDDLRFDAGGGSCDQWLALADQAKALPPKIEELLAPMDFPKEEQEVVVSAYVRGYMYGWISECTGLKERYPLGVSDGLTVSAVVAGLKGWMGNECVPYQVAYVHLDQSDVAAATSTAADFLECAVRKELYLREEHVIEDVPTPFPYLRHWPRNLDDAVRAYVERGISPDALPIDQVARHLAEHPDLGGYGSAIVLTREFGHEEEARRWERAAYDRGIADGTFFTFQVEGQIHRGVIVREKETISFGLDGEIERGFILDASPD